MAKLSMSDHANALSDAEGQKRGMKIVEPKPCLALLHNTEKAASAECCLHVMHALLQGPMKSYAGVLITHFNGVEVSASPPGARS